MPTRIAIIPARSGSKRIPDKNVRSFAGKPLLSYSIQAALNSDVFDRVIVSTDSQAITDVALSFGAEVPFTRPPELSDDFTPLVPVVRHAISTMEISDGYVCCILATAPFLRPEDLRQSLQLLVDHSEADFVVPVTTYPFPIQRAFKEDDGYLALVNPEHQMSRSQDLPERFHDAGQFYWGTVSAFQNNPWVISRSLPFHIPRWRVQDIDTLEDWESAEALFSVSNARQ